MFMKAQKQDDPKAEGLKRHKLSEGSGLKARVNTRILENSQGGGSWALDEN